MIFHFISSLLGAGFGFFLFYGVSILFHLASKKEGLGGGDIKLITAIGAFIGLKGILFTIFISSIIAVVMILLSKHDLKKYFPYGPFIILGTTIYIFFGNSLINYYISFF